MHTSQSLTISISHSISATAILGSDPISLPQSLGRTALCLTSHLESQLECRSFWPTACLKSNSLSIWRYNASRQELVKKSLQPPGRFVPVGVSSIVHLRISPNTPYVSFENVKCDVKVAALKPGLDFAEIYRVLQSLPIFKSLPPFYIHRCYTSNSLVPLFEFPAALS